MKNPLSDRHVQYTLWADEMPKYGLKDLASALDDLHALPKWNDHKAIRGTEIGRNVALFDTTRHWAYRAIKRHWGGELSTWIEVVEAYAMMKNLGEIADTFHAGELSAAEVHHLARSISKWTWRRFTPERFSEVQTAKVKKRWAKNKNSERIGGFLL